MPIRDDFVYSAGIFDGEGCITVGARSRTSGAAVSTIGGIRVVVAMRGPIPDWLRDTFGGSVYQQQSLCNRWEMNGLPSRPFLEGILPFVRHKTRQVELALAFLETVPKRGGRGEKTSDNDNLVRHIIAQELTREKDLWRVNRMLEDETAY